MLFPHFIARLSILFSHITTTLPIVHPLVDISAVFLNTPTRATDILTLTLLLIFPLTPKPVIILGESLNGGGGGRWVHDMVFLTCHPFHPLYNLDDLPSY